MSRTSTPDSDAESADLDVDMASPASSRKRKRSTTADSDGSLRGMAVRKTRDGISHEINLNSSDEEDGDQRMAPPVGLRGAQAVEPSTHLLPWLPAIPSAVPATPPADETMASPVTTAPASPLRLHSPRPRETRSVSYAPTTPGGAPPRPARSALHAYLAPPVLYRESMLAETVEAEASFVALAARVDKGTSAPDLLPSTLPYLVDAYDAIVDEQKKMSAEDMERAKGPFDHRVAIAEIMSRTSNHPLAYSGTSVRGIGGPALPGPASKGSHIVPAFPVLEDGTLAEDAYPIRRVAATDKPYIPRLAFEPHGHAAPLSNPTDPSSFRPLHALLSELPGRTALARSGSGQTWFEPRGRRSEWLTPDIIEHLTYINPPPPLVGKAGTAEEGKRLLYGEGVVAPGWTRDMKVWRQWRQDDDLPSNVIPPEMAVGGNGPTRQPVSAIMGLDPSGNTGADPNAKPLASQPLILLKAAWDTKDRGNWKVWIKPKASKSGRGRILSKHDGQTLDVNVKGEDVEEELDDDDEETVAGTPAPQLNNAEAAVPSASTPGTRLKLNARPSLSIDTPAALATTTVVPRSSNMMGPPPPPSALPTPSSASTPLAVKLKFKLGAGLATPGPASMDSPSPASRLSQPDATPSIPVTPSGTINMAPSGNALGVPADADSGRAPNQQLDDYFSMHPPPRAPPPAPGPKHQDDRALSPMQTS